MRKVSQLQEFALALNLSVGGKTKRQLRRLLDEIGELPASNPTLANLGWHLKTVITQELQRRDRRRKQLPLPL